MIIKRATVIRTRKPNKNATIEFVGGVAVFNFRFLYHLAKGSIKKYFHFEKIIEDISGWQFNLVTLRARGCKSF